jgi:TRAP-type C4-dicarboxylate transport system substrate-binding protein
MGFADMQMQTDIYNELFNKFPEMQAEWKDLKVLGALAMPPDQINTTKKLVKVPEDMKGMKLIAGGVYADLCESVGAAPLTMGVQDWYMSLERGLAEGHMVHLPAEFNFKTLDVEKYHTLFPGGLGMGTNMIIMNLKTWNSLSPGDQKIIEDASNWVADEMIRVDTGEIANAVAYCQKKGDTLYDVTPDELALWTKAALPAHQKWLNDNASNGAQKIYDEALRLIAAYK